MPDELLTIFKLCFLVLLYLFFFRVLRAVWTEVNAPATAPLATAPDSGTKAPRRARSRSTAAAGASAGAPAPPTPRPAAPPSQPAAPTTPSRLVVVDPAQLAGIEYPLVHGMSIGRGAASTIVLEDSFLSQSHSAFEQRDGGWYVVDLGSTNGTYVNRGRIDQMTVLHVGDQVQVGNIILDVR